MAFQKDLLAQMWQGFRGQYDQSPAVGNGQWGPFGVEAGPLGTRELGVSNWALSVTFSDTGSVLCLLAGGPSW